MREIRAVLLAGLICVTFGPAGFAAQARTQKAEVALQAAIKTETVDGNLKSAIEMYRKLANGGHRAVAAKALVRMGRCYEKLGEAQTREARQAYNRVVRDFADQLETAAAAQARLAALDRTAIPPVPVIRPVWTGSEVNADGAPSGDGRYLSYTDRNTANIALRDLAAGTMRFLTKNAGVRPYPAQRSLFSPDGRKVAYTWITGDTTCDIRLIGIDGSGPRVLLSDRAFSEIRLGAWSPDGARIAAAFLGKDEAGGRESNQIALIAVADGAVKILKTLGPRRPELRGFSPDGRFLACDYPPREETENRDIFLLAIDGSAEISLAPHPAVDQMLGWAPDGKGLLFASDRLESWGAWYIRVADGKPKGSPELIKPDMGNIEPLGFTRNGSFYFALECGRTEAYSAALDPAASRLLTPPARVNEQEPGATRNPMYSPDGQTLAYFSNRSANRWLICLRSLKTGEAREFPVGPDLERLRVSRWSANGQEILVSGVDKRLHHAGSYRTDVRSGKESPILSSNPEADVWGGQFTPDGKSLIHTRPGLSAAASAASIFQRDLNTGQEREIYHASPGSEVTNLVLSPDGLELAVTIKSRDENGATDKVAVMSIQGLNVRELLRLNKRETVRRDGLVWTPDGKMLLLAKAAQTSDRTFRLELWRISPRGEGPWKVGVLASEMAFGDGSSGLNIRPDGKGLAFHAAGRKPEIWVMEDIQPARNAAANLEFMSEATAEAWIHMPSVGSDPQMILAKGNYDYDGCAYSMSLTPRGQVLWGVRHAHTFYGDGGDWSIDGIVTDTVLSPNTWYHLAGTIYSGRSASIYVNGALSKTGTITQSIPARPVDPLRLGSMLQYGTPVNAFKGLIEDAAVYDRVLSAEEIKERYRAGMRRNKSPVDISRVSPGRSMVSISKNAFPQEKSSFR